MTQPTDEAAVDIVDALKQSINEKFTLDQWPQPPSLEERARDEIETLRDQLSKAEAINAEMRAAMTKDYNDESEVNNLIARLRETAFHICFNFGDNNGAYELWQAISFITAATRRAEQAEKMLAEVDALFNENINKQADRLGISPDKVESPGQWMMRVRRAAINALKPEQQP